MARLTEQESETARAASAEAKAAPKFQQWKTGPIEALENFEFAEDDE